MVSHLWREFTAGGAGGGSCISRARSRSWHGHLNARPPHRFDQVCPQARWTPPPTDDERVKATMRGIRRSVGTARFKKSPATAERVIAMTLAARTDLKGLRD